jgi:hypothetical protein
MSFKKFSAAESAVNKDKNSAPAKAAPMIDAQDKTMGPEVAKPSTETPATKS